VETYQQLWTTQGGEFNGGDAGSESGACRSIFRSIDDWLFEIKSVWKKSRAIGECDAVAKVKIEKRIL